MSEVKSRGSIFKPPSGRQDWTKGLLSCSDVGCVGCCYAYACPCCASASTRNKYDGSNCCFNCLLTTPCLVTNIIRNGNFIEGLLHVFSSCGLTRLCTGHCVGDLCVPFWCMPCAVTRNMVEVETNGRVDKRFGAPGVIGIGMPSQLCTDSESIVVASHSTFGSPALIWTIWL